MRPLKAYKVTETTEGTGGIVFAPIHAQARREGAQEYGDGDWYGVECDRAPEFDQYAPGPVPMTALLDHGWWWPCQHCNRRLDNSPEFECKVVDEKSNMIWCNHWCRLKDTERASRYRALQSLAVTMAQMDLPKGCIVHRGYVEQESRGYASKLSAGFDFPGGVYGGRWESDHPGTVSIWKMDEKAWSDFKAGVEAHRWADDGGVFQHSEAA